MPSGIYKHKSFSEEHKRKISETLKGHGCSEETRRKISEAQKGKYGSDSKNWKGGLTKKANGYLLFRSPKGCRFSSMKDSRGCIQLHRLIMAEYLQRTIKDEEVVHHINGDITDNRIENLRLLKNKSEHASLHHKLRKNQKGGKHIKYFNLKFQW
jgi:hypothetical protein